MGAVERMYRFAFYPFFHHFHHYITILSQLNQIKKIFTVGKGVLFRSGFDKLRGKSFQVNEFEKKNNINF